ncbi:MAG: hypothetical protein EAZ89_08310 [Bacteroidetes bacterium]|nr:MAG: hypothetical protein EAZ89_08310 [Bacteroidota bacterium]
MVAYLSERGHDCIHTTDFDNGHLLEDAEIIRIAIEQDRTVITKDSDFPEYFFLRGGPPKVLLIEFGNIRNAELIRLFERHFTDVIAAFEEGSQLVVFRRDEIVSY